MLTQTRDSGHFTIWLHFPDIENDGQDAEHDFL